ncbi:MAG: hypothetical protein RMX65_025160 [Nostoc sp. DedQUE01]|nr:hypothetical protein [Nostoc sp. DedQUE11]MDZ8074268.1 hypothetical protein [Nostoc sp. DedQUE01]MDZ8081544.1 hypothetical protein [Nostoc sp. DcaGUA01]
MMSVFLDAVGYAVLGFEQDIRFKQSLNAIAFSLFFFISAF